MCVCVVKCMRLHELLVGRRPLDVWTNQRPADGVLANQRQALPASQPMNGQMVQRLGQ